MYHKFNSFSIGSMTNFCLLRFSFLMFFCVIFSTLLIESFHIIPASSRRMSRPIFSMSSWKQKKIWRRKSRREWIDEGCNKPWQRHIDLIQHNVTGNETSENKIEEARLKVYNTDISIEIELIKSIRGIHGSL